MKAGIESLSFYTPRYYLDMNTLAEARGQECDKFYVGIGQERMSILPPDEDIVTMGASAAATALEGVDASAIDTVLFATESSIDQSKAAAVYVHGLLGLSPRCRCVELKQACSGGTMALLMAQALVQARPRKKVLVVASDVARYGLGTAGEPTQGAGAVAFVMSAQPKLLELEPENGAYTSDVMDFWRPNYRDEALVDGKYSIRVYLQALEASWKEYVEESGRSFAAHHRFCYHMPFTRMAEKAHRHLARITGNDKHAYEKLMAQISDSMNYNRLTGNCYTASLYIALSSLLESAPEDLSGSRVGLFSYGSGCFADFFSGTVSRGYRSMLKGDVHKEMLDSRIELNMEQYETFYAATLPEDGREVAIPQHITGAYRLAGLKHHQRIYEQVRQVAPKRATKIAPVEKG